MLMSNNQLASKVDPGLKKKHSLILTTYRGSVVDIIFPLYIYIYWYPLHVLYNIPCMSYVTSIMRIYYSWVYVQVTID